MSLATIEHLKEKEKYMGNCIQHMIWAIENIDKDINAEEEVKNLEESLLHFERHYKEVIWLTKTYITAPKK